MILKRHDGVSETFVCRDCLVEVDPVGGNYPDWTREQCNSGVCPHCGGADTSWLFDDETVEICIYWDTQGSPEGWAYRASSSQGLIDSGAIEDCDTVDEAIEEACSILGVAIPSGHFATSRDEGGFAIWTRC